MNVYNGVYSWDGTKQNGREPIAWFPGSYHLRIFYLADAIETDTDKKYLCIFSETGKGHCIYAQPAKFLQHICEDFSLPMTQVLWIEQRVDQAGTYERLEVRESSVMGSRSFLEISRREPTKSEHSLIQNCMSVQQV
ncbi:MAG: hypothetical protein D6B25_02820 [Desulfobulbaceae bacterium]|nr:MAG: hypothetical protein D6B25_02820 [Desulfobulbaceae bacterium]